MKGWFPSAGRTRPRTNRSTVRPSIRPSVSRVEPADRTERVHRCRVSNIDRTGALRGDPGGGGRWLWGLLRHRGWPGPNPRTSFITGLTREPWSEFRSFVLCRTLHLFSLLLSLYFSPFLCLFLSSWSRLFALTSPILPASLSAYLSAYSLPTLAPTIDASRLIANPPSIYLL